jgi:putative NIF3 family GTP cyclohydrolase 1 type 2
VGALPAPQPLRVFAQAVQMALHAGPVQIIGDPERPVSRVAVACGSAGDLINDAVRARADAFLTGEARFHECLAATAQGLALVLPGHYATERCGVEELAERLQAEWRHALVWTSRRERDPAAWV